jgi:hypothetical protein
MGSLRMPARRVNSFLLLALLLFLPAVMPSQQHATAGFDLAVLAFIDLNGDGAYGLSASGPEPVMVGINIGLYKDRPPLRSLGPEDWQVAAYVTNPEGYVVFRNVTAGNYILAGTLPDGYLPTTPLEQYTTLEGDGGGAVLEFTFGMLERLRFTYSFIFPIVRVPSVF